MTPADLTALRARFDAQARWSTATGFSTRSRATLYVTIDGTPSAIGRRDGEDVEWPQWQRLAESILGVTRAEVEALVDHAEHLERYVDALEREVDGLKGDGR